MTMLELGIALSIAIGAVTIPSVSSSQNLALQLEPNGVRPVIRDRDRKGEFDRRGVCSPGEARAAARGEGFRNPEVVRVTDRSIVVSVGPRRPAKALPS